MRCREFLDPATNVKVALPDSADEFEVSLADVFVRVDDRDHFERLYRRCQDAPSRTPNEAAGWEVLDPSFKELCNQGERYRFGDIQAAVLRQLYEASQTETPWRSGKQLLAEAGSQSFTLSNVFKRHPAWAKKVIVSDQRGSYRLNPNVCAAFDREGG